MRLAGQLFTTEREAPADAADAVEGLLRQAGYLRPVGAGLYVLGPLMLRVLGRLEAILQAALVEAGYQTVRTPGLLPAEGGRAPLGRGPAPSHGPAFAVTDRRGDDLRLGPDGAPAILDLVDRHVRSYRDLPVLLVDRRTAYADVADRGGLLRARESPRLDAYAFGPDRAACDDAHRGASDAFAGALDRAGLRHQAAPSGAPADLAATSFVAPLEAGPDRLVRSPDGSVALPEVSRAEVPPAPGPSEVRPMELVDTPGAVTIEQLRGFFPEVPPARMLKTMLFRAEHADGSSRTVAALCRGDRQVDERKLRYHLDAVRLEMADPLMVRNVTGAQVGFAGPVGLPDEVRVVADPSAAALGGFVCGANRTDAHLTDVHFGRDVETPELADIDLTQDGDPAPAGGTLAFQPGVRLVDAQQVAPAGAPRHVRFTDAEGHERDTWCHRASADLLRIVAAAAEQRRGADRLAWPLSLAPHSAVIVQVRAGDDVQDAVAGDLHDRLVRAGVDTLWDDRQERAGVKFADAELIGVPIRVTVGRGADAGEVELIGPDAGPTVVPVAAAAARIVEAVTGARVPTVG